MKSKMPEPQIENYVNELLTVLDNDIEHLEQNIACLNELRALMVKHDNEALRRVLDRVRAKTQSYQSNESKRQELRTKLAAFLACAPKKVTLTLLAAQFTNNSNVEITKRKKKLQLLAAQFKKEYTCTQMLLADCARFNRLLLKTIFETGQSGNITYKQTGAAQRQMDNIFMNVQF